VIIGHSERRQYFHETNETVNKKTKKALAVGLTPIVCVGETLQERDAGRMHEVVESQLVHSLADLGERLGEIIVAYEPVWAIGTGRTASGADAAAMADAIRGALRDAGWGSAADDVPILYGGSATSANIAEFLAEPGIDGALVGGASLKPDEMAGMVGRAAITAAARRAAGA
jgi:triosephosphate isomerase